MAEDEIKQYLTDHSDIVKYNATLAVSSELLADASFFRKTLQRDMADFIVYGRSRRNDNPLPVFVFFPRTQRLIDATLRLRNRTSDAIYAFKHGIPTEDDQ